jgi:structure-specific recognition protein 1
MRGQKYDYKIKYDDISRLFLLPKPDDVHMAFVISLDKPIRQGQQRYQHLVLQTNKDQDEVTVNLDEETLKKEYGGELQPVMKGALSSLIAKTFKIVAKKKVFVPGKFQNANQESCIKCALRANEGLLYPLEKQLLFIHKPPVLIRFNEVQSIEFQRYAGGQGSTRNFDLSVTLKPSAVAGGGQNEYIFSGIDRSDYNGLYNFFNGKGIKIINISENFAGIAEDEAPVYNEDEIYGGPDGDEQDEESEDEDYDEKAAAADKEEEADSDASDEDMDSDDFGSEIDDELDSDLEEARGGGSKKKKKKKKKKASDSDDDDDDDDDDDEPKSRKGKRKSGGGEKEGKKKAKKDPKAPKKALSAFMIFSSENRAKIKEENPDAGFGDIGKLVGEAYKNISSEERAALDKKVAEEKARYAAEMADYAPPNSPGEGSGKKAAKGKSKKDPNAPKRGLSAYMFFMQKMRSEIQEENPDAAFGEIGKIVGQKWKELSNKEKAPYEEMAEKDKARYQREMKDYEPGNEKKSSAPPKKKKAAPAPSKDDGDGSDDDSDGVEDEDLHLEDDSDDDDSDDNE